MTGVYRNPATHSNDDRSRLSASPPIACQLDFTDDERKALDFAASELAAELGSVEHEDMPKAAAVAAGALPTRIRTFLTEFRLCEVAEVCVLTGIEIDEIAIGPTPSHWASRTAPSRTVREELILVLLGSVLGDIFGWATQQNGALIHDLVPIQGHENEQLGTGSTEQLKWHTEEAFHPMRCDYLGLMALRNWQQIGTNVAGVSALDLMPRDRILLSEPAFVIRPDSSHLDEDASPAMDSPKAGILLTRARKRIREMNVEPQPQPVLAGDPDSPYLCVDPHYMAVIPGASEHRHALERLLAAINASLHELALEPGAVCFVDNYRAVHGRRGFDARYDGTDRWLKRINVTRDLRKSRSLRAAASSPVVF